MDMRKVRQLAKLMGEMNLSTLEITEGSTTIKLESKLSAGSSVVSPALPVQQAPVPAHTPEGADGTVTVTAPMVGVFYAASAPDAKPFVTLGDTVKKGDVLCIICLLYTSSWGDGRGHKGIDIAGSGIHGSDVLAVDGGVVKEVNDYSSWGSGYGYYVILDHGNNHTTMYAHCSKICVKEGQKIAKGQRIAKIGNTGDSTGPHLHFEIRYRGSPTDPMEFFE